MSFFYNNEEFRKRVLAALGRPFQRRRLIDHHDYRRRVLNLLEKRPMNDNAYALQKGNWVEVLKTSVFNSTIAQYLKTTTFNTFKNEAPAISNVDLSALSIDTTGVLIRTGRVVQLSAPIFLLDTAVFATTVIFTLPAAYRPIRVTTFTASSPSANLLFSIALDGTVTCETDMEAGELISLSATWITATGSK